MGLERVRAKFPGGVIREKHPFYMADAIRDTPGCLEACLANDFLAPLQVALGGFVPQRIFAVGCGTSYNACQAATTTCQTLLGIPSSAWDAYDFLLDLPPGVDAQALVISVSQSGGSLTTCLAQEKASELGARTVGISGNPASRLAQNAAFALSDPYRLEIPLGKTRSYLSSALLGTLAGMATAAPNVRDEFTRQARATLSALKENMDTWEVQAQSIAADWAERTCHYLLTGFGVHKATADEIGLKLIEVIGESATSFGLEEFMHGVNASFHDDMGIFLFQTDPRTLEKAVRIANGVAMSGAALVVITDHVEAGWPEKAWKMELPSVERGGQLGLFPAAVAAQTLMYFLAIAKGLNPDINGNDIRPELGDIYAYFFPPGTH
jgi:glucosamine--fructose-6-phosphate aminotransferase (isomerizing)